MGRVLWAALIALIGVVDNALAQHGESQSTSSASAATITPALTGKERLGPKWTDEQRIDNCRVPADKRGAKLRPFACSNEPSSSASTVR